MPAPTSHDPGFAFDADSTRTPVGSPAYRWLRKAAALLGLAVYAAYLVYRGLHTLNPDAPAFSLAVYLAEVHCFVLLALDCFQIWEVQRRAVPAPHAGLSVDVFVTAGHDDLDRLRQTIRGAMNMRYRHRTFVLDEGRRAEVRALCDELGCEYVTRARNAHGRTGSWNHAFAHASGAFIATFEAGHVPRADFLERTLGFFADPAVAFVQVPQRYHNLDSLQHRASWRQRRLYRQQDLYFALVMPGKDRWNAAVLHDTGAVLRRAALEPLGGLVTGPGVDTLRTSLALHAAGWKSVCLNELLVTRLAPIDAVSDGSQELRWSARYRASAGRLALLTRRGLTAAQRACYAASICRGTLAVPKVVFGLVPPLILVSGQLPIARLDGMFVGVACAYLAALLGSCRVVAPGTGRLLAGQLLTLAHASTLPGAWPRVRVGRRPAPARQAMRFRASVPVELLDLPANGWLGVTLDLSEAGCTMLWPRRLLAGTRLRLRLHLGAGHVDCDGEVVSVHERVRSEWVGHGIRFHMGGAEAVDRLADALYNLAVPETGTRVTRPSWPTRLARALVIRVLRRTRLRPPRYEAYLPMRVQARDGEEWLATTRDLSRSGLSLVSSRLVAPGRTLRLILRSPDGEWSSLATVARVVPMPGADEARPTWLVGLRIDGHADVVGLRNILSAEALA